jgi:predicted permease
VTALTIALGVAATTTVLSVAAVLLFRAPAGVRDPRALVTAHAVSQDGSSFHSFSWLDWRDLAAAATGLEHLAAYSGFPASIATGGEPDLSMGMLVSANYFPLLRTRPALGRFFSVEEDAGPGGPRVAVLSHRTWRARFGADSGVLGRTIRINAEPFTVIGVAEPGFRGHTGLIDVSLFVPVTLDPVVSHRQLLDSRRSGWLEMVGRLSPGTELERAESGLSTTYAALGRADGFDWDRAVDLRRWAPVEASRVGPVTGFMAVLLVLAALILLIASANVANVLVARAAGRAREIAVRLAIGAGRARLVRQLLTESALLFLVGGATGTLLAVWVTRALSGMRPPVEIPLVTEFPLDPRVLLLSLGITLLVGLVFGLVPALQSTRPDLSLALKEDSGLGRIGRLRLRGAFVTAQVAGTTLLLVAAGLFVRALERAGDIDIGFDPAGVHALHFLLEVRYPEASQAPALIERLEQRLALIPGVTSTGAVQNVPLTFSRSETVIAIPGRAPEPDVGWFQVDFSPVTPGYFATVAMPLVEGRSFAASDREGAEAVAIVNQTLAGRIWPGESAVGKVIRFGDVENGEMITIVGVARNGRYNSLGEDPVSMVYVPFAQQPNRSVAVLARVAPGAADPTRALAAAVREIDPDLPVVQNAPLERLIGVALLPNRIAGLVAAVFGATGLTLAVVGLYGLLAFNAGRRRREIGIRMALGATRSRIRKMILRDGLRPVLPGLVLGFAAAAAAGRLLGSLLYGLSPFDPVTYGAIAGLILAAAGLASLSPALRATSSDPAEVLRYE